MKLETVKARPPPCDSYYRLQAPYAVATDAQGVVYLTEGTSDNAFKITPEGVIIQIIDCNGDGAGNDLDGPFGIAVDDSGHVFLSGCFSDNAFKITPSCEFDEDCADDDPCTDDTCEVGECQNTPVPDDTPCDDGLWCTPDDYCLEGACTGTGDPCEPGEVCDEALQTCVACLIDDDCNDVDDCTIDTCDANTCVHTAAAPGMPCGSEADTDCSDPDTCDGAGTCQQNHAPDDTPCTTEEGGSTCLAGGCGVPSYTFTEVPEGTYSGTLPSGGACNETTAFIAGVGLDGTEIKHGVIWELPPGAYWTLVELDELGTGASEAKAVACNSVSGVCMAVGSVGLEGSEEPAYWTRDPVTGDWTAAFGQLPVGSAGGRFDDIVAVLQGFAAAGVTWGADGTLNATVWPEPDEPPSLLPELVPLQATASEAFTVILHPETGELVVGGYAEDASRHPQPSVWKEIAPASGVFELIELPLAGGGGGGGAGGAVGNGGAVYEITMGAGTLGVAGTVTTPVGTELGVLWSCEGDFENCSATLLPPLPGDTDSIVSGLAGGGGGGGAGGDGGCGGVENAFGSSFFGEGSDPFTSGRGVTWVLDTGEPGRTESCAVATVIDANDLISSDVPDGSFLSLVGADTVQGLCPTPNIIWGVYVFADRGYGGSGSRETLPHVAVLPTQPQQTIPTVSTWGMVAMALLILTTGSLLLTRRRRVPRVAD